MFCLKQCIKLLSNEILLYVLFQESGLQESIIRLLKKLRKFNTRFFIPKKVDKGRVSNYL